MRIVIIGYGKMGKLYDNLLHADFIVETYPVPGRVSFTNVEEFISYKQHVDLAIVATPAHTHRDIVKTLLKNNYNVLCEKPITLSSLECKELEAIADTKGLILYQSTLERYNPLIKFFKQNFKLSDIKSVESFRYGGKPSWQYSTDVHFDLAIHDVDLWFYLTHQKIKWKINIGYADTPRREMIVNFIDDQMIMLDLLHKQIILDDGSVLDFTKSSTNNPMLEMLHDLFFLKNAMNESWNKEIACIEKQATASFLLE